MELGVGVAELLLADATIESLLALPSTRNAIPVITAVARDLLNQLQRGDKLRPSAYVQIAQNAAHSRDLMRVVSHEEHKLAKMGIGFAAEAS